MAGKEIEKKAVKVAPMAKKPVRKRAKKGEQIKPVVKPELPADGVVEMPRALLLTLRRHLDVMASFKEWEDKKDPVGECVKNCSMAAFWKMVEAVAYYTGEEKGPVLILKRCSCYSPFHDQSFGTGKIYTSQVRPFLRVGKGTRKKPYRWECILCTKQFDYPGGEEQLKCSEGSWTSYPRRRPKWASYL